MGAAIGSATHQISVWVAVGGALGVVFGILMDRAAQKPS